MHIFSDEIQTPIGKMLACATMDGICLLEFEERKNIKKQLSDLEKSLGGEVAVGTNKHLEELEDQLSEYFRGKRTEFNLPLVLTGTPFQETVWRALQEIPFGKQITYKELTNQLGDPKAIRAVAGANGANKMAIIIPCHRVTGTGGKLTGYAGGLWRKKWLLDHESKQTTLIFNPD
jgi:AraC family transcriptional regulator of adaptative response/methylated-DNA-[protein]-cysteine methyltransferase